jgi:hypothetical protein
MHWVLDSGDEHRGTVHVRLGLHSVAILEVQRGNLQIDFQLCGVGNSSALRERSTKNRKERRNKIEMEEFNA